MPVSDGVYDVFAAETRLVPCWPHQRPDALPSLVAHVEVLDSNLDDSVIDAMLFDELAAEPIELVRRRPLEASIAARSESAFWEGLDGEQGVFLATYEELPVGTQVDLTVHLPGGVSFVNAAEVRFVRSGNERTWPGLGLELQETSAEAARAIARFARVRPSLFYAM